MKNELEICGGTVKIMSGIDWSKSESIDLLHIAECFAERGSDVIILHPVHFKDPYYSTIFGQLIGTKYERKCPDLLIDGLFYEYESYVNPWSKRKLSNMISYGLRQSDRIIINNRSGVSQRQILRSIRARLDINAIITEVWTYDGLGIMKVYP